MNAYCLHEKYNNGDAALEPYPLALPEFMGLDQEFLNHSGVNPS